MPLEKSNSRSAIGRNISTEVSHGKPRKQAIAIALDTARKHGGYKTKHQGYDADEYEAKYGSANMPQVPSLSHEPTTAESAHIKAGEDKHVNAELRKVSPHSDMETSDNYEARYASNCSPTLERKGQTPRLVKISPFAQKTPKQPKVIG